MLNETAEKIFKMKYAQPGETWEQACWRVASYIASAENDVELRSKYETEFFNLIYNLVFIPGGRVLANAGTGIKNLLNCFVLPLDDSRQSIYETLGDAAEIFAHGGGIGYNVSNIREEGAEIKTTGGQASGPISFLTLFDTTGDVIAQASRRGAQLACLNVDHPDVEKFILYKSMPDKRTTRLLNEYQRNLKSVGLNADGHKYFKVLEKSLQDDQLSHFNISVLLTDKFIDAVKEDKDWDLISRKTNEPVKTVKARELLKLASKMAWESGDPGLLFYDRANEDNMVKYMGDLKATNPCFFPDTYIETVHGRMKIKDIKDPIAVYTMDEDKKLSIRMATGSWISRKNAQTKRIKFNNNEELIVTPEHLIFSRKRGWVKAKDLQIGEEVVSLCRARRGAAYSGIKLSTEHNRAYRMEHRFVYEQHYRLTKSEDIHHIDGNTFNNDIDNLISIPHSEHARLTALTQPNNHQVHRGNRFISGPNSRHGEKTIIAMPKFLQSNFPGQPRVISVEDGPITDVYDMSVEGTSNLIANYVVAHNCVTGDTLIHTVYDGAVSFKELAEKGDDVLVYTWNPETKLPEVSMMKNPRKTRENAEVIRITFDSGLELKCTPDHNLYTFRGDKIQARDLKEGQSVRAWSMSLHARDGHYRVHGWVDGKARHKYTARLVWEYYNGPIEGDLILHHIDFDKLNNRIENFELLSNSEHNSVHYPYRVDGGFGRNHKVVKVEWLEEKEDVYNGTVENTHTYIIADPVPISGMASGIVSANCGEIWLLPYEACCLGSLNLNSFYDKETNSINFEFLEYATRTAVRFLDDVQEVTKLPDELEKVNTMNKGLRRLGLGVMGWADLLANLGLAYDSEDAKNLGMYLSWFISFFGWLESMALAEEKGAFAFYDKNRVDLSVVKKTLQSQFVKYDFDMEEVKRIGFRNVAITAIAPTGTIALLAGVNSGIEPFFALAYKRNITEGTGNTAKDYIIEVNNILMNKLIESGLPELEKIKKEILKFGTLENMEEIPGKLKSGFRTAHDIHPKDHVDMQAAWSSHVDNSISKTINLPEDSTVEDIENIYLYMYEKNLKGGTVYRDRSKFFQILNVGK